MEIIKPSPEPIRLFYFWIGLAATVAYRLIIIFSFYSPLWVKVSWYVGTLGFILYFWHRFKIQKKRADLVEDHDLINAVESTKYKTEEQKQAMNYIVKTTFTSKARWNSLIIFLLTIVALIIGVVMDIMAI